MDLPKNYQLWKEQVLPPHLQTQLTEMDQTHIIDAFSANLEFGTAGLRALVGPGSNRINEVTITKANSAFLSYLKTQYPIKILKKRGIVIAHDNRHFSSEFAMLTAEYLASQQITTYLFANNELRPTPVLSYSIKQVEAIAGIVITASHNPPAYNGYKIYNEHGCQFLPLATNQIAEIMAKTADSFDFKFKYDQNLIKIVPSEVEEKYRTAISNLQFYPNQNRELTIVFSNLHGTARDWVKPLLTAAGYKIILVKEQADFDPDFKGVISPNPEVKSTFNLAIQYAKQHNADLVILNDPDADRIGIAVKHDNQYVLLNGNETAPILLEYLLSHYQIRKTLPTNPVMYNTFVTGTLSDEVAKSYGCQVIKTLTGFKWIAAEILKEKQRGLNFVFGFEEAYGYVINNITLDKDGIQAAMVLAEACWFYRNQQKNLITVLDEIYQKFGYYYCYTVNIVRPGLLGKTEIATMMNLLRESKITALADIKLTKVEDYSNGLYGMPGQDLIKYYFADGSWFAVRPSGTEPKIKFYFVCVDQSSQLAKQKMHYMFQNLAKDYLNMKVTKEMLNDN